MKLAISSTKDNGIFYGNYGVSPYFLIYDNKGNLIDKRLNPHGVGFSQQNFDKSVLIIDLLKDCKIYVCRMMGKKSKSILENKYGKRIIITEFKDPKIFLESYFNKK